MLPYSQQEGSKVFTCPHIGVAEDLEYRKPCSINTDTCLYGSPGSSREGLLGDIGKVFDELICRPSFPEGVHLGEKLFCIFLILCEGIGPCKGLPINCTEKGPAPLIVPAGFCRRIKLPVDRAVEFMAEDIVFHYLFSIIDNLIILQLFCVFNGEEIYRILSVSVILHKLFTCNFTHKSQFGIVFIQESNKFFRIIH